MRMDRQPIVHFATKPAVWQLSQQAGKKRPVRPLVFQGKAPTTALTVLTSAAGYGLAFRTELAPA
jgi:hypothetical protein